MGSIDAVVGLQRGDEGKGRFVDMLAEDYEIVARFNGGANAGHTVVLPDGREFALHQIPSGITHEGKENIVGNGTLLHPERFAEEIEQIESKGVEVNERNLKVSSGAHLTLPHHVYMDELREVGEEKQGSTKLGIAQVAAAKSMRQGVRAEIIQQDPDALLRIVYDGLICIRGQRKAAGFNYIDELEVARKYVLNAKKMGKFITDTVVYINQRLEQGANVLAEGAQAFLLDVDHGMYPYTSSTHSTSGGVATGLGVGPSYIDRVYGVVKMVQSHVGGGPFVTEIQDEDLLKQLHGDLNQVDSEKGTTTGRKRRLGYLDLPQIRRAQMVNGEKDRQSLLLSKLDWLPRFEDQMKVCVGYDYKGERYDVAPGSAYELAEAKPIYESFPTWNEDISDIRDFNDLPQAARDLVTFISDQTGVQVDMVGVGPGREQVVELDSDLYFRIAPYLY